MKIEEDYFIDDKYLSFMNTRLTNKEAKTIKEQLLDSERYHDQLKIIYENMKDIYSKLQPLRELGLNFSLTLAGGAVRDLLLNKPIHDLDIIIEYHDTERNDIKMRSLTQPDLNLAGINSEDINRTGWNNNHEGSQEIKLTKACLASFNATTHIMKRNPLYDSEMPQYLSKQEDAKAVIKFKTQNFETELFISNLTTKDYIDNFNVNLSKVSLVFIDGNNFYFPTFPTFEEIQSRFQLSTSFLADIKHKKITCNIGKIDNTDEHIISVMNYVNKTHKKYPEYEINLASSYIGSDNLSSKINKLMLKNSLEKDLNSHTSSNKQKRKI